MRVGAGCRGKSPVPQFSRVGFTVYWINFCEKGTYIVENFATTTKQIDEDKNTICRHLNSRELAALPVWRQRGGRAQTN